MDNVPETLFLPLEEGWIPTPESVLFINAGLCPGLELLRGRALFCQQYFLPDARLLQGAGFAVWPDFPLDYTLCEIIFTRIPKSISEARYMLARGLPFLKEGGVVVCAAGNKAGGTRLAEMLEKFGLEDISEESKNKARVVWAKKTSLDDDAVEAALREGAMRKVSSHGLFSMPGIFSWDEIDAGSQMLADHLPSDFKGAGADFGCGYGFLSQHVLRNCPGVEAFSCIDADYRALQASRENLKEFQGRAIKFVGEDLRQPKADFSGLDFIVMNPPFHEGKKTDPDIGRDFISTASRCLKPGGVLWMVANAQLPYEPALKESFKKFSKKYEGKGFKVYCAVK